MFGPRNRTWVAKTVDAQEEKREAKEGARPMTVDWSFVQRSGPFFVKGTLMTLFISVFGILLAIAVGLVCAGVEIARIPVARQIVRIYIELSRNTPLLVQLYFLY
ncbi:ABC transporter permease subunit, partial [Paeniclostridium sordellii]|nr:ABC transporter permease subunit [Paeniclostridium sordellii]